jgi:hypothetical protein
VRAEILLHHNCLRGFTGGFPVAPLNLAVISELAKQDRATIDNCVREIVQVCAMHCLQRVMTHTVTQAFGKRVHDVNGISLEFPGIGRITAKHSKVCALI